MMNMDIGLLSGPSSSSGPVGVICDDSLEDDACSICLEPFTSFDPPSVTECKHEYHLHCILEWSQRRIECPICSGHLVLKDPASQELLAGVERDRLARLRHKSNPANQENETNNGASHVDESDLEHGIMRHFAAIAGRARNIGRRRRQMSTPSVGPSQILPSVPSTNTQVNSSLQHQNLASCFSYVDSTTSIRAPAVTHSDSSITLPSIGQSLSDNPGRPSSSEFVAFSESLKSKISTASTRYKESISKSTRGLKERLIARNDSVKELSRGVQREMSAGIAGISRMIERLDITPKRSVYLSTCSMGTSNTPNDIEDDTSLHSPTSDDMSSDSSPLLTNSSSGGLQVSLAKEKN